jgi:hypothetical protein
MSKAPIVLFVYNRPWHTQQAIEALQKNELACESELFIYSDASKAKQNQDKVQEVRDYIHSVDGFKKIIIIERDKNWGLANSIIDGVTAIVNQYGKIIVLEDDIVTSPYFLRYMNDALNYYQDTGTVMHVSGWNYPIELEGLGDVFFWHVMNCWGWATWENRWSKFENNPHKLINDFTSEQKSHFDLDDSGVFWSQIVANSNGKIDTWAIFWYATIYQNKGLCLSPSLSYVENIGHDGSGVHCADSGVTEIRKLNQYCRLNFDIEITESGLAVERVKGYYTQLKKPLIVRIINKMARILLKRNLIQ